MAQSFLHSKYFVVKVNKPQNIWGLTAGPATSCNAFWSLTGPLSNHSMVQHTVTEGPQTVGLKH